MKRFNTNSDVARMPVHLKRALAGIIIAALAISIAGCSEEDSVKLSAVEGMVKIGGVPAENIMVNFLPIPANKSMAKNCPTSSGVTDHDGHFRLKTLDGRDGAVTGKCLIELVDLADDSDSSDGPNRDPVARAKLKPSRVPSKYDRGGREMVDVKEDDDPIVIDIRS